MRYDFVGAVIDNEFKMVRDPYEARYEKDASSNWAFGHELKSYGWSTRV